MALASRGSPPERISANRPNSAAVKTARVVRPTGPESQSIEAAAGEPTRVPTRTPAIDRGEPAPKASSGGHGSSPRQKPLPRAARPTRGQAQATAPIHIHGADGSRRPTWAPANSRVTVRTKAA